MAAQSACAESALLETLEIISAAPAAEQPRRKIGADMSAQTDALDAEILSRLEALGPGSHARKTLDGADDPAKVRASLSRLVDAGKVIKIGRKKGTRYALLGAGATLNPGDTLHLKPGQGFTEI